MLRRIFRPRLPSFKGVSMSTTRSSLGWTKAAFSRAGATCPVDGCDGILEIEDRSGDKGDAEGARFLVCPKCGTEQAIDDLLDAAASKVDSLRKGERQLFLGGAALFVATTILAVVNGDPLTFFGGAVFALILIQRAMIFRYKAWQATNRRLFQDRPPVREWLADEFR